MAMKDVRHFTTIVAGEEGDNVEERPATVRPARQAGAHFTADRLVIEPVVERLWGRLPFVTRRGNDAVIAISVVNTGDEGGTFTTALVLDGEVIGWRDVGLAPGEQKQVRFLVGNITRGTHWVSLSGFTGTFTSSLRVNWGLVAAAGCVALGLSCIAADRMKRTYLR